MMSDLAEDFALNDVEVDIVVVLGASTLRLNQILQLGRGAVVELESGPNDQVEVYANDILIAKGEVVITGKTGTMVPPISIISRAPPGVSKKSRPAMMLSGSLIM